MNGPSARPNRFWNSDSTDAPVERTPGWITSITIAATGPTVQVIEEAAERDQRELALAPTARRRAAARRRRNRAPASSARHSSATHASLARAARRGRHGRPPRPRRRCRARRHSTTSAALTPAACRRQAVHAVQVARQPRPHGRDDDHLRRRRRCTPTAWCASAPAARTMCRGGLARAASPASSAGVELRRCGSRAPSGTAARAPGRESRPRRTRPASPSAPRSRRPASRRAPSRPRPTRRSPAIRAPRMRAGKWLAISAAPTEP